MNLPHYKSLTSADILFSEKGRDGRVFAKELKQMVNIALKHPSQKCSTYLGSTRCVVITQPHHAQEILDDHLDDLVKKESIPLFRHSFPNAVMAKELGTKEWKDTRSEISKQVDILVKNPQPIINIAIQHIENFKKNSATHFDLKELAESFTLDVIFNGFLGTNNIDAETKHICAKLVSDGIDNSVQLFNVVMLSIENYLPCHLTLSSDDYLKKAALILNKDVLAKHKQSIFGDQKNKPDNWTTRKIDFETTLAKEKNNTAWFCKTHRYTNDDLVNDISFLMTAGSDTSAKLFMFMFLHVTQNPRILTKVIEEVRALKKSPQDWTSEDLQQRMPYIDMVILEALRRNPPILFRKKKVKHSFTTADGTEFKTGDHIFLHIGAIQCSEKTYEKPLEFCPERFENENPALYLRQALPKNHRHRLAWQPFSYGPRMCPGAPLATLEAKIGLAVFASYFDLVLEKKWQAHQTIETFSSRPDESGERFWVKISKR